jgi:hypothetical protein
MFFCFRKEEEQRCSFFVCFVFSWFLLRHSSLLLCVYEFVTDPPPGLVSQSNFFLLVGACMDGALAIM